MKRNPRLAAARNAKRAGMEREEYLRICTDATNAAADEQNWRPSERAMALGEIKELANKIWPVKAVKP